MLAKVKLRLLLFRDRLRAQLRRDLTSSSTQSVHTIPPAPTATRSQQGIAIVAVIKDEASYLAEWIEFHLMLGVRHIFLYDNGSTDNTPRVLAPYFRAGSVTLIPWWNFSMTLPPQGLGYAHALCNFAMDFRWVAFIDVDEFLFPVQGNSLDETLDELAHLPAVCMPWINFGPSGHQKQPEGPVIANYTERAAFPPRTDQYSLLRYKSIVNPREVESVGTHICLLRGRGRMFINDRGQQVPFHQARNTRYATADKLRLHHYFTRSYEEIEKKIVKGRVSKFGQVNPNALDRRLRQYALATERDETIKRFLPELQLRLAKRDGTADRSIAV